MILESVRALLINGDNVQQGPVEVDDAIVALSDPGVL